MSFSSSLFAALVNVVFGIIVAWVLVRYKFPGRRILDAIVDLPFALPTAVAGIALSTLYAPKGWIGSLFSDKGALWQWWHAQTWLPFAPISSVPDNRSSNKPDNRALISRQASM